LRAFLVALLVSAGCAPAVTSIDAGAGDTSAPVDANRVDAGFDPSSLPPCTLVSTSAPLALAPLVEAVPFTPAGALEQRAFYVLLVLRTDADVRVALEGRAALAMLTSARDSALRDAASTCGADAACLRAGVAIAPADVEAGIAETLAALEDASLTAGIATALRTAHVLERFAAEDDGALIRTALDEAITALHAALDAYAVGELAAGDLDAVVDAIDAGAPTGSLAWWEPLARTTITATLRAGRDEPVRYEPIDTGENAAALATLGAIDWSSFPYAALLVPGQGPTDPDTVLHPNSAQRADLAAERFRAGLAPLIVLSGGHVHPDRTRYSEAIEMKRYLVTMRGIPESAILVDPYARHTTTNLRDVTRVLLRAGVPSDARVLVVTDLFQTLYIRDPGFATRCDDELHFRPYEALEALSSTDTCMTMSALSLTTDASDLLDP
jgi:hypothetical protein